MSTTLAFRLILGLVVGGVLTCSVWDRNDRELKEQPADEDTRTGMPRFRSFAAAEMLPTMLVTYLVISFLLGGREMAVQYLLGLLLRVFLLIGVYYVLLLAVMPLLRRHISARVCAVLWLLPGYLYFLAQVSSVQRADPGGERMLVLHASGTLVTVLLAVWAAGAIGVFAWKIISHLRFRRRVLKDAVVVTDEQTLAVWRAELARAWLGETKWTLVHAPQLTTPLSIGLFQKTTCVALPARSYTPEELSLILRHEIIHLSRRDPASKFFMVFCTAMCWFNPLMWVAMRKSADDFELSCDESVLLAQPQPVRRQYAELLLKTAGDERGFTTCLSATASALRYRLKNIMVPGKKHTGALLVGLTFLLLTLCAGHVALAYDAQPGAARIFNGRPPEDFSLRYVDVWNDDRGSGTDFGCTDEAALKDYLAALQLCEAHEQTVGKLVDVRDHAAERIARRMAVEIGQRQTLQVGERLPAHVARHGEADPVVDDRHQPLQKRGQPGKYGDFHRQRADRGEIDLSGADDRVDGVADEDGDIERPCHTGRRQKKGQQQKRQIAPKASAHAKKRFGGSIHSASSFLSCERQIS